MDDSEHERATSSNGTGLGTVPSVLRFLAFALVLVGFGGAYLTGSSPLAFDTIYGVLFVTGVVCAIASIYLAIFQANRGGE